MFVIFMCVFFFLKQKTAYEMRISDWSSDVCSSDLFVAITRELPTNPSNFRSVQTLPEWMIEQGVIGLAGIDTRALTRRIRDAGAPNGVVAHSPDGQFDVDRKSVG